jgi:hypothetical protein
MSTRRLAFCAVSAAAVTLAACGAGTTSHVVQGASQTTATSTSTVATGSPVAPASTTPTSTTPASTPTTTAPSDVLGSQTLDQVAAELGALDDSLNTANSDLNNPQGDS